MEGSKQVMLFAQSAAWIELQKKFRDLTDAEWLLVSELGNQLCLIKENKRCAAARSPRSRLSHLACVLRTKTEIRRLVNGLDPEVKRLTELMFAAIDCQWNRELYVSFLQNHIWI